MREGLCILKQPREALHELFQDCIQFKLSISFQGLIQVVQCAEAPSIVEHPLDITVERNEPVTLKCKVKGVPKPTIEWFRNGERVVAAPQDPSSHRILLPDGSLFFLRAVQSKKEQDGGVYWCVARNSEGVARSSNATMDIACEFLVSIDIFKSII